MPSTSAISPGVSGPNRNRGQRDRTVGSNESDIEELFEIDLFTHVGNETYDLQGGHPLTGDKLNKAEINTRTARLAENDRLGFEPSGDDATTRTCWRALIRGSDLTQATALRV